MTETVKEYLKPEEVAAELGIGVSAVYPLLHSGRIKSIRPTPGGKKFIIPRKALEEYVEQELGRGAR